MVIEWYGEGRVRLGGDEGRVWMDAPNVLGDLPEGLDAHVVTVGSGPLEAESTDYTAPARHVSTDGPFVVRGPGEYEVHAIFVTAVTMYAGDESDAERGHLAVNVRLDDVAICHLGDRHIAPDKDQIEMLGNIDVLLIPIGGSSPPEPAKSAELVAQLEPSIVVPIHFDPADPSDGAHVERFLAELGLEPMEPLQRLQAIRSQLPDDLQAAVLASIG